MTDRAVLPVSSSRAVLLWRTGACKKVVLQVLSQWCLYTSWFVVQLAGSNEWCVWAACHLRGWASLPGSCLVEGIFWSLCCLHPLQCVLEGLLSHRLVWRQVPSSEKQRIQENSPRGFYLFWGLFAVSLCCISALFVCLLTQKILYSCWLSESRFLFVRCFFPPDDFNWGS